MQNSVNQRIKILVDELSGGNKSAFARSISISNQSLGEIIGGRQSAPSFAALQKIISAFPQVQMEWLIMGRGPMLVGEGPIAVEPDSADSHAAESTMTWEGNKYTLSPEQWTVVQQLLLDVSTEQIKAQVEMDFLSRMYHFGKDATPGLKYDDRISTRLNLTEDELRDFSNAPEKWGNLRYRKFGERIIITEHAIREWLGDLPIRA